MTINAVPIKMKSGASGILAPLDRIPDSFVGQFIDNASAPIGQPITSANQITVTGIDPQADVSISVDIGEYQINANAWTSVAGVVNVDDLVRVRHTSSASPLTATNQTLTIDGEQDTFTSTTVAAPVGGSASLGTWIAGEPLERRNIRWTFDRNVEYGAFANGDYYVVFTAGLRITSIQYTQNGGISWQNGSSSAGSMVNPVSSLSTASHGLSSVGNAGTLGYNAALNIALNLPYTCAANQSIISTSPFTPVGSQYQTYINDLEVLTILNAHASQGDFRPYIHGSDKTILYNKSNINYTALANLTEAAGAPSMAFVESLCDSPWVEIRTGWSGRYTRPHASFDDYPNTANSVMQLIWLKLNCNFTDAEKETLAINVCQGGLDYYGCLLNGGNWSADGGNSESRKTPIIIAGAMLNNLAMQSPNGTFGEDQQAFYVSQSDCDATDIHVGGNRYFNPIYTGTASATDLSGTTLTVASATFVDTGIPQAPSSTASMAIGRIIKNLTTGESAIVSGYTSSTEITHSTLPSGWTSGDNWELTELGMAEWGNRHAQTTTRDHRGWVWGGNGIFPPSDNYRLCCTSRAWFGSALAIEAMGLKTAWNNNAYFDYVERVSNAADANVQEWPSNAGSETYEGWVNNMYLTHHNFPV